MTAQVDAGRIIQVRRFAVPPRTDGEHVLSLTWDWGDTPWAERAATRRPLWCLIPSLGLHVVLLVLLAWATVGRPIVPRQIRAIEVELIDQTVFEDEFEVPPDVAVKPLAVPVPAEEQEAVPPAPTDGMTAATELFSSRVLSDPQNRQVQETLPQLENTERITQLCIIEGLEQLRLARPGPLPDSISPSAFAPTLLRGLTLEAPQAAFRAARQWYFLRFSCTVAPGLGAVGAYRQAIGDPIPQHLWEAHDLIAEDEDE